MSYGDFRDDVKIEKQAKVTIEGRAVAILRNACELARRHLATRRRLIGRIVDEFDERASQDIETFLQHIFDNT